MDPSKSQKQIKDLHKGNKFKFNYSTYLVKRKWINDDKPLIAYNETKLFEERFYFEELEIEQI